MASIDRGIGPIGMRPRAIRFPGNGKRPIRHALILSLGRRGHICPIFLEPSPRRAALPRAASGRRVLSPPQIRRISEKVLEGSRPSYFLTGIAGEVLGSILPETGSRR